MNLSRGGRITRRYRDGDVRPPCDTLESLDTPGRFLEPGVTFGPLDATACPASDFDAVQARDVLFHSIGRARGVAARWPWPGVAGSIRFRPPRLDAELPDPVAQGHPGDAVPPAGHGRVLPDQSAFGRRGSMPSFRIR